MRTFILSYAMHVPMAIVDILPMRLIFVAIFGLLPVLITIHQRRSEGIRPIEWASFGVLVIGALLTFVVADRTYSVQMQRYIWPLLITMGVGLLIYRIALVERGAFSEESIERGGTSYE